MEIGTSTGDFGGDSSATHMRKHPLLPRLDPLGLKTGIELAAGGLVALVLMRWLGM